MVIFAKIDNEIQRFRKKFLWVKYPTGAGLALVIGASLRSKNNSKGGLVLQLFCIFLTYFDTVAR